MPILKKIKVLQLHPDFNVKSTDISDLAEQIIKGLPADEFEVTSAYLCKKPKPDQKLSIAQHSYYFNLPESSLRGLRIIALWKMYRYLKKHPYDVVICNRFKTVSMILLLNKLLKIPLCLGISHVLNEYDRKYRQLQVKILADYRWHFVGVSEAVKTCLTGYNSGFTESNTTAIANAIDTIKADAFQLERNIARERLNLPLEKRIIGTIGQLFPRKGHRFLISALAKIKHQFPDVDITIIGRGREEENLRKQISENGLEGRVHLLGFRENALQYAKAFDIWAMPSLKEGLPLALLEGISGRLPVIASDIPEMHDTVKDVGGVLFKPGDINALTSELINYLSMPPEALKQKGETAFHHLVTHHSIEQYRENYHQLIRNLLRNNLK